MSKIASAVLIGALTFGVAACTPATTPNRPAAGAAAKPAARPRPTATPMPKPPVAPLVSENKFENAEIKATFPQGWTKGSENARVADGIDLIVHYGAAEVANGAADVIRINAGEALTRTAGLDFAAQMVASNHKDATFGAEYSENGEVIGFQYQFPSAGQVISGYVFVQTKGNTLYVLDVYGNVNNFSEQQALGVINAVYLK